MSLKYKLYHLEKTADIESIQSEITIEAIESVARQKFKLTDPILIMSYPDLEPENRLILIKKKHIDTMVWDIKKENKVKNPEFIKIHIQTLGEFVEGQFPQNVLEILKKVTYQYLRNKHPIFVDASLENFKKDLLIIGNEFRRLKIESKLIFEIKNRIIYKFAKHYGECKLRENEARLQNTSCSGILSLLMDLSCSTIDNPTNTDNNFLSDFPMGESFERQIVEQRGQNKGNKFIDKLIETAKEEQETQISDLKFDAIECANCENFGEIPDIDIFENDEPAEFAFDVSEKVPESAFKIHKSRKNKKQKSVLVDVSKTPASDYTCEDETKPVPLISDPPEIAEPDPSDNNYKLPFELEMDSNNRGARFV